MDVILTKTNNFMRPWRNWQTRKTKDLVVDFNLGGSSPLDRTIFILWHRHLGRLAQLVERLTLNQ